VFPSPVLLIALAVAVALPQPAAAAGSDWQIAGKTYNSVAFLDLGSVSGGREARTFTAMRVSGQPDKDGWSNVVQQLTVDCETRIFVDAGSRIEKSHGTVLTYPGSGASQRAVSRGVFFDMYEIVCSGRGGTRVSDPLQWTRANFRPGG
jgi:hypothetical protein